MESNYNNKDFEQFIRQNADQYRMFPSERVWNGIQDQLHHRKRWYGWGLGLLILTTGVVSWVMLNTSVRNRQVVSTLPAATSVHSAGQTSAVKQVAPALLSLQPAAEERATFITSSEKLHKNIYTAPASTASTDHGEKTGAMASVYEESLYSSPVITLAPATVAPDDIDMPPAPVVAEKATLAIVAPPPPVRRMTDKSPRVETKAATYSFQPEITVQEPVALATQAVPEASGTANTAVRETSYPLSIESVTNAYIRIPQRRKGFLQAYVTPTISYRELKENKDFINSAQQANTGVAPPTYSADINSLVTHKPDIGLQMGIGGGLPISRKLSVIGGLQFNISKYDIQAYSIPSEMATIAIRNDYGRAVNMRTVASYRNVGGNKENWLHNLYFTASLPIGLELKTPANQKKSYFGISGTVQPTVILSNRAYVISTDYKNYAEMPSLTRRWNINTGFDLFVGYNTGNLKWRVGPQVRYQVMSSFIKEYPVQEHLFDFGVKMGIMLK